MLERMVLRNFKCFDALDLTCSPLTMLCGVNGMGKSSVIQALLVLRQSAASGELNRGKLVLGGELTDIGAGQDVLFEDAEENVIAFELYHQAAPAAPRQSPAPRLSGRSADASEPRSALHRDQSAFLTSKLYQLSLQSLVGIVPAVHQDRIEVGHMLVAGKMAHHPHPRLNLPHH